jgi:alkaline phosphatase
MKKGFTILFATFVALVMMASSAAAAENVIVLVPDGCDQNVQTAARWYKKHVLRDNDPLALDQIGVSGMVKTYMANSITTGSAAAATAFATGYKTTVRFLGVGPDPALKPFLTGFSSPIDPYAPVQSVLEAAKLERKATGLVATSRITHATPAAYACHIKDRGMDNEIMEHLVYQDLDVVFGGGARHLIPSGSSYQTSFGALWGGRRSDGEDLIKVLEDDRGYQFVDSIATMSPVTSGRVWGMFDDSHMEADIDREEFADTQPSLAEMTDKAIELLSQDEDGFFLMVEGSQVDWAGHAMDPIHMITDFLAFDEAVAVALDFAKGTDTAVYVFPDHDTGAMSISHEQSDYPPGYTETTVEDLVDPLRGMLISATGVDRKIRALGGYHNINNIQSAVSAWWGISLSNNEAQEIKHLVADGMYGNRAIGEVVSKYHTVFGWTTHGHAGGDVPLWTYYNEAAHVVGLFDNTDLANLAASDLGVDPLAASSAWTEKEDTVLDWSDPENPVAVIDGTQYPVSKDIKIVEGVETNLHGITVYNAGTNGKVYIPIK